MIESTTLDDGYGSGLSVDAAAAANLRKAGKWARFIGIVTMVFIGIGIVSLIAFGGTFFALFLGGGDAGAGMGAIMTPFLLIYVLLLAFFLYLTYLLYRFGVKAMATVDHGDAAALQEAFGSLGRLLKIYGILMIISLVFNVIGILGVVAGGLLGPSFD